MSRFSDYLRDTRVEVKHVSWPTQRQAVVFTALVVGFSLAVSVILGLSDFLFTRGVDWVVMHFGR